MHFSPCSTSATSSKGFFSNSLIFTDRPNLSKEAVLIREHSSNSKPKFYRSTVFFTRHSHFQRVHSVAAARYRLYCIIQNGRSYGGNPIFLQILICSRQVGVCAQKSTGAESYRTYKIFGLSKTCRPRAGSNQDPSCSWLDGYYFQREEHIIKR